MAFDPDAFLATPQPQQGGFDPDAFLAGTPAIDTSKGRAAYMKQFPSDEASQKKAQNEYEKAAGKENVDWHKNVAGGAVKGASNIGRTLLTGEKFLSYPQRKIYAMATGDKEFGVDQILNQDTAARNRMDEDLTSLMGTNPKSGGYQVGKVATEIAGTAGIPIPYAQGAKGFMPRVLQAGKNIGIGAGAGGAQGFVSEGQEGVMPGAIAGGALSGGLEVAKPLVGSSIGKIYDFFSGKGTDIRAAKIGRDVAGDKLDEIKALLAKSQGDENAIQAAVGADSTRFSALGKRGEKVFSESANALDNAQEAGRTALLNSVKPDLAKAENLRKTVTDPMYNAAKKAGNVVDTKSIVAKIDDLLERNSGNPEFVTEFKKIRDGLHTTVGKKQVLKTNAEQISSSIDGIKAALGKKENKFIIGNLNEVKDDLVKSIPGMKEAQAKFAELSPEVNQSKVIQAMQDTLKANKGGERVEPFLNAMGRGENALIKKADQSPRFGKVEDILSPQQLAAREKVVSELMRDAKVEELAKRGAEDTAQVLAKDASKFRLPWTMSAKVAAMNKGLDVLETSLNSRTMEKVYKAMQKPKDTLELLNTLPATERVKVINAMMKMNTTALAPVAGELAAQKERK
jgi:hypothetical protein